MRRKSKTITAILTLGLLLAGGAAQATCVQFGKVARLYTNMVPANSFSYVYILPRTTGVPTHGYYYRVPGTQIDGLTTVVGATASDKTVRIQGNSSSCPGSGTWRFGGTLETVNVYGHY